MTFFNHKTIVTIDKATLTSHNLKYIFGFK